MPNLKDAPVLLGGQVIDTSLSTNRATGEVTGRKVTVMAPEAGGPGFAVVNVKGDDLHTVDPQPGQSVLWMVRAAPYDISDGDRRNVGMSVRYLRTANEGDLDLLASYVSTHAAK